MANHIDANPPPEANGAKPELKAGMPAKFGGSVGVIKEIFRSETSENVVIQFTFPKNIFKSQSLGDIVLLKPGDMWRVEPATVEELREHIRLQKALYLKGLDDLFGEVLHESS
ncbi:MAG: hypothetical protein P8Z00_12425 [Anaerolineales bacterium]|jgi:hypothetical protein